MIVLPTHMTNKGPPIPVIQLTRSAGPFTGFERLVWLSSMTM